jgi:hypothetical protein
MYLQSIPCAAGNSVQTQGGLGCAGLCCGGNCGLGLFDSGLDYTQWGIGEYAAILGGAYLLFSVFFTTKQGVTAARALPGKRRRSRAARLRAQAKELSKA